MAGLETVDTGAIPIPSDHSITLDLPPSCIEFSTLHNHPDCFVVGTYYLEPEDSSIQQKDDQIRTVQDRRGSLMLFNLEEESL